MAVKKKTAVGMLKGSVQTKSEVSQSRSVETAVSGGIVSMRRIVAKKLAVEKLVTAKGLR